MRSDRPSSRSISLERPEGPRRSRRARSVVAPGSIAYSPVNQPPRSFQRGRPSSTEAATSTRVAPNDTCTDPAGDGWTSTSKDTGRS